MADALGFALGCVGLSLPDFCALTPSEFRAVCDAWGRRNEGLEQGAWERMRLLATITIQPHVKKRLTPGQLLPLPWEKPKDTRPHPPSTREKVQEVMQRGKKG